MSTKPIIADKRITTREFSEQLDLHVDTVKRLCLDGKLDAEKLGGRFGVWLIKKSEVSRYRKQRRKPGRPKAS